MRRRKHQQYRINLQKQTAQKPTTIRLDSKPSSDVWLNVCGEHPDAKAFEVAIQNVVHPRKMEME